MNIKIGALFTYDPRVCHADFAVFGMLLIGIWYQAIQLLKGKTISELIFEIKSIQGYIQVGEGQMSVDKYIDDLIKREGGYVNNPNDRGGATNYGITEAVARVNGWKGPMRDLPLDLAKQIYKQQYWINPRFDQVNTLSPLIAEELLDTGVNCGVAFAKPLLQRIESIE